MAKPTFYSEALASDSPAGLVITLSAAESAHAVQSRRLVVGTEIALINATGVHAEAKITTIEKRSVSVTIDAVREAVSTGPQLHLAVAMPKGDRQKQLVDMLTQLGVSTLVPMVTDRSISLLKPTQQDKLSRVSLEACKQSQNPWRLNIESPQSLVSLLHTTTPMFYASQGGLSWMAAKTNVQNVDEIMVFIGPEGGFSATEELALERAGATPIKLGQNILRTETAAVAAATLFKC